MKGDTMRHDYIINGAADAFVLGIIYKGNVYMKISHSYNWALYYAKVDKTSKSHGQLACLRFRPTADQKKDIVENWGATLLCSLEELDDSVMLGENRGHAFERLAREALRGWACTRRGWWEGADFVAGADSYQAKFEGGTFCTAKQCREHRTV